MTAMPGAATALTVTAPRALRGRPGQFQVGAVIVGLVLAFVYLGPLVYRVDPLAQDLAGALAGPSAAHPLGTDQLGRDLLARLMHGGQIDLFIATVAVVVPLVVGSLLGAFAGYWGRWVDVVIMRLADIVAAFPFIVLEIALVFVLGNGAINIFIAISLVSWVAYARIVRGETLVLRKRDFVAAGRSSGLPDSWILFRHVIPNTADQSIVYAMSDIVMNIGVIVTLSFFGIGIVPPTPDWGQMMNDGKSYLLSGGLPMILWPGLAVVIVSLGLSLVGDGLAARLKARR